VGVSHLNCSGGQLACGRWAFEITSNPEGFNVPPGFDENVAANHSATNGGTTVAPAPPSGHGNALALSFASNDCSDINTCRANLAIVGNLCPGGGIVHLGTSSGTGNNQIMVDVYFQKTGGAGPSSTGPFWMETLNGGAFVANSGDQQIIANEWRTYSVTTAFNSTNDQITQLRLNASFSTEWIGTMFIDNIRFAP
jgi:hypothetical protein